MNEVVPKLGNYWLFAAERFSSAFPPIHFGREVPVYAPCGTLAAKVNLMSSSQWLPVRWIAALAGRKRPKWLGLETRTSLIGIISVKPAKKCHIFLPITARNLIFVSGFVIFYADKYGLHLN